MQQSDDRRRPGRPSLLSEQAPAADDQSILNKLDGRQGNKPAPGTGAGGRIGRVAGIAAVLVGGGALAWVLLGSDITAEPAAVAADVARPVAAPPVAAAADSASAPPAAAPVDEQEVSAATILQEEPEVPTGAALTADGKDELTALLDNPSPPAVVPAPAPKKAPEPKKPAPEAKKAAPESKKAAPKPAAKKSETVKLARKDKEKEKDREKDKKTVVAAASKKKPEPKVDDDVALLAALLTHSKASTAPRVSKTATEYKRCGTLATVAEADKCRERLCESNAKAKAECKTLRPTKVSS